MKPTLSPTVTGQPSFAIFDELVDEFLFIPDEETVRVSIENLEPEILSDINGFVDRISSESGRRFRDLARIPPGPSPARVSIRSVSDDLGRLFTRFQDLVLGSSPRCLSGLPLRRLSARDELT